MKNPTIEVTMSTTAAPEAIRGRKIILMSANINGFLYSEALKSTIILAAGNSTVLVDESVEQVLNMLNQPANSGEVV